eukprot:gene14495-biopygen13445
MCARPAILSRAIHTARSALQFAHCVECCPSNPNQIGHKGCGVGVRDGKPGRFKTREPSAPKAPFRHPGGHADRVDHGVVATGTRAPPRSYATPRRPWNRAGATTFRTAHPSGNPAQHFRGTASEVRCIANPGRAPGASLAR